MLRHWRHEIADHTITHRTPTTWWKNATYDEWSNEISGQREILRKFGGIDEADVKGFRAPYLQLGGNRQFKALLDNKFLYDSSMPTLNTKFWPYTLDYKTTQECTIGPCPTGKRFYNLWLLLQNPCMGYLFFYDGSLDNSDCGDVAIIFGILSQGRA